MQVHVTLMGNITMGPMLVIATVHDLVVYPPVPNPVPYAVAFEANVPIMWPPGFGLQQNKLTTTVFHKAQFLMLEGHDCGYMIPHVTIPPNNVKLLIIIPFSSRKAMFSASKVKANGTAVGCSQLLMFPLPLMTCWNPVNLPSTFPSANVFNTVLVGMTLGDLFAGLIAIACSIVADLLCWRVFKADMFEALGPIAGGLAGSFLGFSNPAQFLVKTGLGALAGAAKIWLTGEGTISVAVGSSYAGGQASYTSTADGGHQVGIQGQVGGPLYSSASGTASHTWNKDGTTGTQTSTTQATPLVSDTETTATEYDASGKATKTTETESNQAGVATPLGSVAGSQQKQTTTTPTGTTTTESSAAGVSTPLGGGTRSWGRTL